MVRFIFPKSGHLSQLHSPFFTVNQELPFLWALGCFLSSFLFSFSQVLFLWEGFALFCSFVFGKEKHLMKGKNMF